MLLESKKERIVQYTVWRVVTPLIFRTLLYSYHAYFFHYNYLYCIEVYFIISSSRSSSSINISLSSASYMSIN